MTTTVTTAQTGPLTANGVTALPFTFQALSTTEVTVTRNGVTATPGTYTVTLNADGTGSVTPTSTWGTDSVYIYSAPNYQQLVAFNKYGAFYPDQFNAPFDRLSRALLALRSTSAQVPLGVSLASKVVGYDAGGLPALYTQASFIGPAGTNGTNGTNGLPGLPGTNGGIGSSAGNAALFTAAAGMTIGTGITAFRMSGYSVAGIGGGYYIYDAAVTGTTVTANPRTQFLSADARGWRLDPKQRLTLEMFGGIADWNGTTGTDNYAAFTAAAQFTAVAGVSYIPTIHMGIGAYYTATTPDPAAVYHFKGEGCGLINGSTPGGTATRIITPTNTTTWRMCGGAGLAFSAGGAINPSGSILEGIRFEQATQGTDLTAHGIHARYTPNIINCAVDFVAGDGVHIRATAGGAGSQNGNANNWRITNLNVHSCGGNAVRIDGADANAGVCTGLVTSTGVGLAGYFSSSYYVNTIVGAQFTGFNNTGVQYLGRSWQPIAAGTNQPPANGSVYWYDRGPLASPSAQFPAWNSATAYVPLGPCIAQSPDVFVGTYIEGGGTLNGFGHAPNGTIIGTDMGWTDTTPILQGTSSFHSMTTQTGIGHYRGTGGSVNHPAYPTIGAEEFTLLGAYDPAYSYADPTQLRTLMWHRIKGIDFYWRYAFSDMQIGYGAQVAYYINGASTTRTFGRSAVQPYFLTLPDYGIIDSTDGTNARIHGLRSAVPSSGNHAAGEFMWNNTGGSLLGWTCTATGTPGTWQGYYGMKAGQQTGWTTSTGTPARGAFAAAAAIAPSAAYVQSEATNSATRIAALEARLIALETDLRAVGIIN